MRSSPFTPFALVPLMVAVACGGGGGDEVLAKPGELGRCGVGFVTRDLRVPDADGGRTFTADVYRPFVDELLPPSSPPVVFVQGGLVPTARYRWLALHEAARCHVVALPHHIFDLAFFDQAASAQAAPALRAASRDVDDALVGLVDDDAPAIFLGHSLGGVVATKAWLGENHATLVLLASEPDPADEDRLRDHPGRVVSIVGSRDGKEKPAEARAGAEKFADADFIVVDGMNHYQLTDDPTDGELAGDGHAGIDIDEAHARVLAIVDDVIDEAPR